MKMISAEFLPGFFLDFTSVEAAASCDNPKDLVK
jgi:hypothetical protein